MMDYLQLVNKENRLDKNYKPKNLVEIVPRVKGSIDPDRKILIEKTVLSHWILLKNDAKKCGFDFDISSGYRSYSYQEKVLRHYIEEEGLEEALAHVAPPGASEHQTGLAIDYFFVRGEEYHYDIKEDDPEYIWLKENAHKFGFIIRYPKEKESITGYIYEPWHLRYVGEHAKYIHNNDLTLEEYIDKIKEDLYVKKFN